MGGWRISRNLEIIELEIENILDFPLYGQLWQFRRVASELQIRLFEMVEIQMGIAERVDKVPRLQPGHVSNHFSEQGIAGDIEGDA